MKFIVSVVVIMLLSFSGCLYLPWWWIAVSGFLVITLIPLKPSAAFLSGFIALFILWISLSGWISYSNQHILAHRVSLLVLKIDSPLLLILTTGLIGGIVGGLGALTASFLRNNPQH